MGILLMRMGALFARWKEFRVWNFIVKFNQFNERWFSSSILCRKTCISLLNLYRLPQIPTSRVPSLTSSSSHLPDESQEDPRRSINVSRTQVHRRKIRYDRCISHTHRQRDILHRVGTSCRLLLRVKYAQGGVYVETPSFPAVPGV